MSELSACWARQLESFSLYKALRTSSKDGQLCDGRSGRDRAAVATGRDALQDALPRDPALHVQRREERQRLEPSLTRLASHPAALPRRWAIGTNACRYLRVFFASSHTPPIISHQIIIIRSVSRRQERGQSGQRLRQLGQEPAGLSKPAVNCSNFHEQGGFRFLRAVPTRSSVHVIEALRD
jgi:hypothetical protein